MDRIFAFTLPALAAVHFPVNQLIAGNQSQGALGAGPLLWV